MSESTSSISGLPPEARTALASLASSDPTAVADLNQALAPYTLLPQGGGTAAREPAARVDAPAADTFTSLLLPANNSGVLGAARVVFDEAAGTVTVDFRATGLTPGQEHALHIHGFSDDRPSLIPNAVLDADRDGFVEDHEGEAVVGPVILALTADGTTSDAAAIGDFPVADASGALALSATYQFDLSDPGELVRYTDLRDRFTGRELQIHGRDVPAGAGAGTPNEVDGTAGYKAVLPVGNGILLPVVQGDAGDAAVLALVERLLGGTGTTTGTGTTPGTPGTTTGTAAGGAQAQITRLYDTAFDRAPDAAGLAFWTAALGRPGTTLDNIGDALVASPELRQRIGTLSDTEFVTLLYRNGLEREPEPEGLNFWVSGLQRRATDRGDVLSDIADSPEGVASALTQGIGTTQPGTGTGTTGTADGTTGTGTTQPGTGTGTTQPGTGTQTADGTGTGTQTGTGTGTTGTGTPGTQTGTGTTTPGTGTGTQTGTTGTTGTTTPTTGTQTTPTADGTGTTGTGTGTTPGTGTTGTGTQTATGTQPTGTQQDTEDTGTQTTGTTGTGTGTQTGTTGTGAQPTTTAGTDGTGTPQDMDGTTGTQTTTGTQPTGTQTAGTPGTGTGTQTGDTGTQTGTTGTGTQQDTEDTGTQTSGDTLPTGSNVSPPPSGDQVVTASGDAGTDITWEEVARQVFENFEQTGTWYYSGPLPDQPLGFLGAVSENADNIFS